MVPKSIVSYDPKDFKMGIHFPTRFGVCIAASDAWTFNFIRATCPIKGIVQKLFYTSQINIFFGDVPI